LSLQYNLGMLVYCVASRTLYKTVLAVALATVATVASITLAQETTPAREQTVFHEYEPVQHAVPLSPEVLQVLLRRKEVKEVLEFASKEGRDNPSQFFEAAKVHLRGSDEADLVVQGYPPVSGADNAWFWVVLLAHGATPRIVLWGHADSLEVMSSRTNGYRNIHCSWSSASGETIEWKYHFNGEKYILWKKTDSLNR
jgi:hypothetical protein